jgi:transcriptional regulator
VSDCTAVKHGDYSAYTAYQCKCPSARRAHNRYQTRLRMEHQRGLFRKLDATGTQRRLRALNAIGWADTDLARKLGMTKSQLHALHRRQQVHRTTAQRVTAIYGLLCETPGSNTRAARRAARNGWLAPKWWDDELMDDPTYQPPTALKVHWSDVDPIAVERACAGDRVPLTRAERIHAVLELDERGVNHQEISRRLGVSGRQVLRDVQQHRELIAS